MLSLPRPYHSGRCGDHEYQDACVLDICAGDDVGNFASTWCVAAVVLLVTNSDTVALHGADLIDVGSCSVQQRTADPAFVRLFKHECITHSTTKWDVFDGRAVLSTCKQLSVILVWAVTIPCAQGSELDSLCSAFLIDDWACYGLVCTASPRRVLCFRAFCVRGLRARLLVELAGGGQRVHKPHTFTTVLVSAAHQRKRIGAVDQTCLL